mgnify:CR=1 FL=1
MSVKINIDTGEQVVQSCSDCKNLSVFEINKDQDPFYFNGKRNDFSIYGVFRFTAYIVCSFALYFGDLEMAGLSFGFGASLGFLRRIARIWE